MVLGPEMVHILGVGEELEKLDSVSAPTGDISGQLFENKDSSLPATERNRMRHLGARTGHCRGHAVHRLVAD